MNAQNRSDFKKVLNEIRDTRNSFHVFGELNRELLLDIREITRGIRFILSIMLGFVIFAVMLISLKFIAAALMWLIGNVKILKDFESMAVHENAPLFFMNFIIVFFGFLTLFFIKAASSIFKN